MIDIPSLFVNQVKEEGGVSCLYASLPEANFDQAVSAVAHQIAIQRISQNPRLYEVWLSHADGASQEPLSQADIDLLTAGLLENIGARGGEAPANHLHGLIAEQLWHEMISVSDLGLGKPIRVEAHDWSATDPGGDGLTVHQALNGGFSFRLWESKYLGSENTTVRDTVGVACRQMKGRAISYLSRFSVISQRLTDNAALASFYGQLPELWVNKDASAGASVVVGSSEAKVQDDCFVAIPSFFELGADRHQGQLNTVGDFERFAKEVRKILWRGCGWIEP